MTGCHPSVLEALELKCVAAAQKFLKGVDRILSVRITGIATCRGYQQAILKKINK